MHAHLLLRTRITLAPRGLPRLVRRFTGVTLVAAGGLVAVGCGGGEGGTADAASSAATDVDERDVQSRYVGSRVCADCHEEVSRLYASTPKARSLTTFDPETAPEELNPDIVVRHLDSQLRYQPLLVEGELWVGESRLDAVGTVVHHRRHRADLVIGSGAATRSYLMAEGGYLTEMPLTWYQERRRWDMSPGYEEANDRFGRRINLQCITCHSDRPSHSEWTQNHYGTSPDPIGCERCHGPGGSHVAARREAARPGQDTTIVQPARLDRGRQLAVCQQCHLAGVTVFRPSASPLTFRPGEALHRNRTVFVPEEQLVDPDWVGIDSHPLRLARSACYQASEMTCSTCHDPHRPTEMVSEQGYRQSCVTCHGGAAGEAALCSREGAASEHDPRSGDCVSCHMRRGGTSDVPHVSFTDHWIRVRPGPPRDPSQGRPALESPEPIRLVALQEEGRSSHDLAPRADSSAVHDLERAAAYWTFYETMHRHPSYPALVVRLARRGFARGGDLPEARIALGRALAEMDSVAGAEAAFREAVSRTPGDPWGHFWLGALLEEEERAAEALAPLREALLIQPLLPEARIKLAEALYRVGRPGEAREHLEALLGRDPYGWPRAWFNLSVILWEQGEVQPAVAALEEASRLDPDFSAAHVRLAGVRMALGDLEDAEAALHRALVTDSTDVQALGSVALLHLERGDTAEARRALDRVLRLDPGNPEAARILAGISGSDAGSR